MELFINSIDSTFDLDISGKYMLKDVEANMVCEGINVQIDELTRQNDELYSKLELLKSHILTYLKSDDKNQVSINRLDKEGFYLALTKNRYNLIKDELLNSHIIIWLLSLIFK